MDNYYVLPLEVNSDFIWCVMENKTEQLIKAFEFEEDALDYAAFLESGGGFDGFTPTFVLREISVARNVNHDFTDFLAN